MRAIILLAVLGSALAVPDHIQRIVGGNDTTIETYPFMVNMQYHWFGIFWIQACGGSLITPLIVLTAAHCVEFDEPHEWRVILGTTQRSGAGGNIHALTQFIIHPEYEVKTPLDADVAIIRLASVANTTSDRIATIPIASSTTVLHTGLPVTTIGWGTLTFQGASPEILQHVHVYVIDQQLCAQRYAELKAQPGFAGWPDITDNMVCAGILDVGGKDGCQGDSGGPVVYRGQNENVLVGLTSWGYQCALPRYPGVSVNVAKFTNWILETVN